MAQIITLQQLAQMNNIAQPGYTDHYEVIERSQDTSSNGFGSNTS